MIKPLAALGEVFKNLFRGAATDGYPFEKPRVDKHYRARIRFDAGQCVGCQMCVRNCPASAIKITHLNPQDKPAPGPDGKMVIPARHFSCEIDLTKCIFCAQCVDSCFKKALRSSQDFELACADKTKLKDTMKADAANPKP